MILKYFRFPVYFVRFERFIVVKMSVEGGVDKLCHQWIVEYDCWRMWSEFAKSGTVDDGVRDDAVFHSSTLYAENSGDRKIHDCRLLIHFICKIADATKEMLEDVPTENQPDVTPRESTLEEAIDLLDYISNAFTRLEDGDVREVKLCLKRFAVLAPLYKGDQRSAKVPICLHYVTSFC